MYNFSTIYADEVELMIFIGTKIVHKTKHDYVMAHIQEDMIINYDQSVLLFFLIKII